MSDMYEKGTEKRRKVLGDAHVDRSMKNKTPFDEPFQNLITESAWGHVWSRPQLTDRERSLITLALLAGLGNHEELVLHTKATANTGASAEDLREMLLHVAIYAGVPRANSAFAIVKKTLAEINEQTGSGGE